MGEVVKIILVILLSSVKFVGGPPFAYYDQRYDFTFFETVLYCVIGGTLGVVLFTFFSRPIFEAWHFIKLKINNAFKKKEIFSEPEVDFESKPKVHYDYVTNKPKKVLFTPYSRKIIRIWRKYGLFGIALITPIILSIPIGTILANSLESNRKKVIIYMFFSVLFWSITMTSLFELFHAATLKDLKEQISK